MRVQAMNKGFRNIFKVFVMTPAVMQLSVLIALESACPAATLRLEVIKTLPYPNIGSTTPGVEQFPRADASNFSFSGHFGSGFGFF